MIRSFRSKEALAFYCEHDLRLWAGIREAARRKLDQLECATSVDDLRWPPGNRLERITGDRKGQNGMRINKQWRICFVWLEDGAHDVEIVDYH